MGDQVWITGYGLVSPAGDEPDACWAHLNAGVALVDRHPVFGCPFFPVRSFDSAKYIPRSSDRRWMGNMMRYAVAAAVRAVEMAHLKSGAGLEILVAGGAGERDIAFDETVLAAASAPDVDPAVVNRAFSKLRPSLYGAQLPNLVASNIAIVLGFAVPSRTLLGSELAGVEVLRQAHARIQAGQGEMFLVGAAKNAACVLPVLSQATRGAHGDSPHDSVWSEDAANCRLGSAGAFIVVESARHAAARGARPIACLTSVISSYVRPERGRVEDALLAAWRRRACATPSLGVISGISGDGIAATRERAFLAGVAAGGAFLSARAPARVLGYAMEANFVSNLVLALLCFERGELFAPLDAAEPLEAVRLPTSLRTMLVTCWTPDGGAGFAQLELAA